MFLSSIIIVGIIGGGEAEGSTLKKLFFLECTRYSEAIGVGCAAHERVEFS